MKLISTMCIIFLVLLIRMIEWAGWCVEGFGFRDGGRLEGFLIVESFTEGAASV